MMAAADGADGLAHFLLAGWTGYLARRMMDGNVFFWVDKRTVFPLHFFNALTALSEIALKWR